MKTTNGHNFNVRKMGVSSFPGSNLKDNRTFVLIYGLEEKCTD